MPLHGYASFRDLTALANLMLERVESVLEQVRTAFEVRAPFAEDRDLATDLSAQARPVVRAFCEAFERVAEAGWEEAGEAYSLLNLLGRHLGESGMTPGAATIGCDLLFAGLCRVLEPSESVERGLTFRGVFFEGYVGGVQARSEREQQAELEQMQPLFVTASGTCVLMLSGPLRAESIERIAEEFGRVLFRRDAQAAIVDLRALSAAPLTRDVLDAVLGIDEQARTLGCRCTFAGIKRERAQEVLGSRARIDIIDFTDSLDGLLDDVDMRKGRAPRMRAVLRRLDKWLGEREA